MLRGVAVIVAEIVLLVGLLPACRTSRLPHETGAARRASEPSLSRVAAIDRAAQVSNVEYDLEFELHADRSDYSGRAQIHFDYRVTPRPLRIDFFQGRINRLTVNGRKLEPRYNGSFLTLPPASLAKGKNRVLIRFRRDFSRDGRGFVRFEDPEDKRVYTFTDLEPYKANRVFPCFDQPDLRASYTMRVTAPETWHVVTSVRERSIKELPGGFKVWEFPRSARFSTYVWSLHAGPYQLWKDQAGTIPLRLFARQSLAKHVKPKDWFTFSKQGFEFFPAYFDYPYPYEKYDQIIVPEFNAGAMENVAAVTFSERFVSRGPKSQSQRRGLANTLLHEMAHMWFGDLVTMKWWNDLWLNESFATYMAHLALARATEFKATAWRAFHGTKRWAYWEDQLVTTHPIEATVPDTRQAFANFDGITYGKGAAVLKQVAFLMGAAKFRRGVRSYFKKHAGNNTVLKDFMAELSAAHGSSLTAWQKEWLQTSSLNTVSVRLECKAGRVSDLTLVQSANREHPHLRTHRLQVALFGGKGSKLEATAVFDVRLTGAEHPVSAAVGRPCPTLVYPNYRDHAYLKVRLDAATRDNLHQSLHQLTDPFQRQLFWGALWEMVRDGKLHLMAYAELALRGLDREQDEQTLRNILTSIHGRHSNAASIRYYLPRESPAEKGTYTAFWERLERLIWRKLKAAHGGSEAQKIWLSGLVACSSTPFALAVLKKDLLDGATKLDQLPIDQHKRWSIVWILAAHGYPGAARLIEAEFVRDSSADGKKRMLAAQASSPDWKAKEDWLAQVLQEPPPYSFDQLKAIIRSLFPGHQAPLRQRYAGTFFRNLETLVKTRDGFFVRLYTGLVPSECGRSGQGRISAFLARHPNLHPSVAKSLEVSRQESQRCRTIRAMARRKPTQGEL